MKLLDCIVCGVFIWISITDVTSGNSDKLSQRSSSNAQINQLHASFSKYVYTHDFYGASLGVLYGDRLVFAEGRGFIFGKEASASSVVPILGLSKTLTAVAIYKLAEGDMLDLDAKVFGDSGVLSGYEALEGATPDPRLYDITLNHLLHHTAGWDETQGPVYDPMYNTYYLTHKKDAVNIARSLSVDGMVNQYDIISFMMGQHLHYAPGTQVKQSNFGYSVLGRVVEEVTGVAYDEWVKTNILEPAGMWHTRLGPGTTHIEQMMKSADPDKLRNLQDILLSSDDSAEELSSDSAMHDIFWPEITDSTLGWYSSVYDVGRLFTCLFKSGLNEEFALLKPETLTKAMTKPSKSPLQKRWFSLGFLMNQDGSFHHHSVDQKQNLHVFFYHKTNKQYKNDKNEKSFIFDFVDDSTLIFLGYSAQPQKHMRGLAKLILSPLSSAIYLENAYLKDLGDNALFSDKHDIMIKYKLDEHHLIAYVSAMRMAGYYPKWIHGYNFNQHTYFITIFERATEIEQLYYKLVTSASPKKLAKMISNSLSENYEVSFLQSFDSAAHDHKIMHIVLLTQKTNDKLTTVFEFGSNLEKYLKVISDYKAVGFNPLIQSVNVDDEDDIYVSYILQKVAGAKVEIPTSQTYVDLTFDELQLLTKQLAQKGFSLVYIDTFFEKNQPRFSAIFRHGFNHQWLLQNDVSYDKIMRDAPKWNGQHYTPLIIVAYERDGGLHYAGMWTKQNQK